MKIKQYILFGLFIYLSTPVFGKHIIGGDMTYVCLGNGDYEIELKVYRDTTGGGAPFDAMAAFSLYECGGSISCTSLDQGSQGRNFAVPLTWKRPVIPNELECLEGMEPGVEEGLYKFKLSDYDIQINPSNNSFFIVYQRCCRNVGISNIFRAENRGSTYFVEITPESQNLCNSSPVFNNFPDLVICQNFELIFDHSATDPDGDSLVYYFTKPIDGGGNDLSDARYTTCIGARPIPPCPPITNQAPYFTELSYQSPNFDDLFPLGKTRDDTSNTTVTIDSMNGLISGVPGVAGLFVVSVAVEEYRGDTLLGTIRRDFQYTIGPCSRNIEAIIKADVVIGERAFRSTICRQNDVLFEHESTPERYINEVQWEFDLGNCPEIVSTRNEAIIDFPETGLFMGELVINPGSRNCEDRATINVNILPETIADFEFDYDECEPGFVSFNDLSTTDSEGITSLAWDFGDGRSYNADKIEYLFPNSGNLPVSLTVTDVNNCQVTKTDMVAYFPLAPEVFVAPSASLGCAPASITFDNLDSLITDEYDIEWDFGDGGNSNEVSPTYEYETPGTYAVSLDITNPFDCRTNMTFPGLIQVQSSPIANFTFSPEEVDVTDPTVSFFDNSLSAISWLWDFNGAGRSMETDPVFTFPDTGMQVVRLIVTHQNGCTDTMNQIVDIFPSGNLYVPNAFTPNGDGKNDIFIPVALFFGANNYSFTIWNRWGEQVFFTNDVLTGWNGRKNNTGKLANGGVYIYQIEFTDSRGQTELVKGIATLVR